MDETKTTHTVRTVSRHVLGETDETLLEDAPAPQETDEVQKTKRKLKRRLWIVGAVLLVLILLLFALGSTDKPATKTAPPPLQQQPGNLDNLEIELKKQMDGEKKTDSESPKESPKESPPPAVPAETPARTPFDDLNVVQEVEIVDPNAPIVEQTITESGETILRITPQKPKDPPPEENAKVRHSKKTHTYEDIRIERVEPEDSSNLPMQSRTASAPLTQPAAAPTKTARMPRNRFHVQAGIFMENNHARALYQRLRDAGIPTAIESRVQVGPFNSRREAEAARQKLKAMGIDSIVIAPQS